MQYLFRFLLIGFFFVLAACEQHQPASLHASALDADAGDEPASWEGDWTWEDPVITADAGTVSMPDANACTCTCASTSTDAGQTTPTSCSPGERFGPTFILRANPDVLGNCAAGWVVHAWGPQGEEYVTDPGGMVYLFTDGWTGYVNLAVTCGNTWTTVVDWSAYLGENMAGYAAIMVTASDALISEHVSVCRDANGIARPMIQLVCSTDPCP